MKDLIELLKYGNVIIYSPDSAHAPANGVGQIMFNSKNGAVMTVSFPSNSQLEFALHDALYAARGN